jgi:hypothetical protein
MPFITDEELTRLRQIETTMDVISTCSPAATNFASDQPRACKLCQAIIDEARDALGYQRCPTIARSPTTQRESK